MNAFFTRATDSERAHNHHMVGSNTESNCFDPLNEIKFFEEEEDSNGGAAPRAVFEYTLYGGAPPVPAVTPNLVYLSGSIQDMEIEDALVIPVGDDVVTNITPKSLL